MTSNKDCVINKLKEKNQFSDDDANKLLRYASQEAGARHPFARGPVSDITI